MWILQSCVDASLSRRRRNKVITGGRGRNLSGRGEREGRRGAESSISGGDKREFQKPRKMNINIKQCGVVNGRRGETSRKTLDLACERLPGPNGDDLS